MGKWEWALVLVWIGPNGCIIADKFILGHKWFPRVEVLRFGAVTQTDLRRQTEKILRIVVLVRGQTAFMSECEGEEGKGGRPGPPEKGEGSTNLAPRCLPVFAINH